jgi:hypothetical protein
MPMQRFPLAIGEDQKMRRGKIEVILGDFDAEKSWHSSDGNQNTPAFQVERRRGVAINFFPDRFFT